MSSYQEKVTAYNNSPNHCLACDELILLVGQVSLSEVLKRKFCNKSCAAIYNNKVSIKRARESAHVGVCADCGVAVKYRRSPSGGITKRKFCKDCVAKNRLVQTGRCSIPIGLRTKGDLFSSRTNWQSARTAIRKHSSIVMETASVVKACKVCGYSIHVEICHIKAVSDFNDDSLIADINAIENLVYLCPNHHWEFDNGLIDF